MEERSISSVGVRLLLLLVLTAWLIGCWRFGESAMDEQSRRNPGYWLGCHQRVLVRYTETIRAGNRTCDIQAIDPETRKITRIAWPPDPDLPSGAIFPALERETGLIYLLRNRRADEAGNPVLIRIDPSAETAEVLGEIHGPPFTPLEVVGEHFLVGNGHWNGRLWVLDVRVPGARVTNIAFDPTKDFILKSRGNRFCTVSLAAGKPRASQVVCYAIDDSGRARQCHSWTADSHHGVDAVGESIFSVSANRRRVERRDAESGELLSSVPLPDSVGSLTLTLAWPLLNAVGWEDGVSRYYDLERERWLPDFHDGDGHYLMEDWTTDQSVYFHRYSSTPQPLSGIKIFDREANAFLEPVEMPAPASRVFPLDNGDWVATSNRWGGTIYNLDRQGGVRSVYRPMAWELVAAVGLVVAFVVWSVAWMRVSARAGSWAWFDALLVLGMPALVLLLRFVLRGDLYGVDRVPHRQACGIVMAAQMLAAIWIVFGKTRFTLRFLPSVLMTALLMGLLGWVFRDEPWIVWHVAKVSLAPAFCLTLLLLIPRRFGWNLVQLGRLTDEEPGERLGVTRFPIRDLVWITIVASVAFAAIRPVSAAVGELWFVSPLLLTPLAFSVGLGLVATFLALHRVQAAFWLGAVLAIAGLATVVGLPGWAFIHGGTTIRGPSEPFLQAPIVCGVAVLIGMIPFRLRGWRLTRKVSFS